MVLRYRGVTPRGTDEVDLKALGDRPDPARVTHAVIAQARGEPAMVQEISETGTVKDGQVRLPNLVGVPMRSVLKQLSDTGLVAVMEGSGLLTSQTPPPGSVVKKGSSVELVFRPAS
jgi:cell division protein FtsI (penicillin-binding protein 3)